jgi:hypothetical protein
MILVAIIDEDAFLEGYDAFYGTSPNRWGLVVYVLFMLLICAGIIFFTTSLIHLHINLNKMGITAYEFIVYKEEKEERQERLDNGAITHEEWEEEETQAKEDMRK